MTVRKIARPVAGLLPLWGAALQAQIVIPHESLPLPSAADRLLLKDAIDIHAHFDPALERADIVGDPISFETWLSSYPRFSAS